ncbi:hypothetical protein [Phaeobacter sp. B1627]|uniref:hypothetical protein n=1 Tax=Phaeobacter sp. B1627 TaxID=2583809 RepID=UPI00111A5931|nr:hypothetical protein [Phaeobacter sp. B1627]TNJ38753.1 hypothetical protein FGE21_19475 [Phaeobacter sp. B1627]
MTLQATPQLLMLHRDKATSSFLTSMAESEVVPLNGSVVTCADAPGAVAYTAASWGRYKGKPTQRVLLTVHSPNSVPINKTLEFRSPSNSAENALGFSLPGLALSIVEGLLHEEVDSADYVGRAQLVPLLLGPSSVALDTPVAPPETDELFGLVGGLVGLAATVIPAVAPVALDVAKQLLGKDDGYSDEEMASIFGTIASIAKVAVPIAGTLLTSLGDAIKD